MRDSTSAAPEPPRRHLRVGLDVGGTKTEAVALDEDDHLVARARRATGWGPEGVVRSIVASAADVARQTGQGMDAVSSIGVGLPGRVGAGWVRDAVNLGVEELALADAVQQALGIPTRLENDVKAAALGVLHSSGIADDSPTGSLAYLNLGTGVAAGLVVGGELMRGNDGIAGEIGHVSIDPLGPLCRCGQRGCIEALAGGGAVARLWGKPGELPVRDVFDAADVGDPLGARIRDDLVRAVAAAVRVVVLTVDVDTVVLGGGVSRLGGRLLDPLRAALDESAARVPFLRSLRLSSRVHLADPEAPGGAIGAALVGGAGVNVAGSGAVERNPVIARRGTMDRPPDPDGSGPAEREVLTHG